MLATFARAEPAPKEGDELNPFTKSYLRFELQRDYPEAATQYHMTNGNFEPSLTYLHTVNGNWLMGLGGGLKVFNRLYDPNNPPPSRTLAVYTLSHETMYVVRLSHPSYMLLGPKILYLLPALTGQPPPQRDTVYLPEIGLALSVQYVRLINDRWLLSLRMDRWRGVNTSMLAGLEVAVGAAFAFSSP